MAGAAWNLRTSKVVRGLFALGLGLLLGVLAAEVVLRAYPGLLPPGAELRLTWQAFESPDASTVAHPYIGYLPKPHQERVIERTDLRFTSTIDGHGFRNEWPWPERADVVTLGDSMTFAFGVDDDETWSARLAGLMPELRVLNLGMDGAAPQQCLRIYETFGSALRPKLLVFGLFPGNDVRDARLFDEWLAAGGEGNFAVWRHFGGGTPEVKRGVKAIVESSYLLTGLRTLKEGQHYPARKVELPDGSRLRLVPGFLEPAVVRSPDNPVFRGMLDTIERMRAAAEADGASLLVLLFPTKEEVYLPALDEPCPDAIGPFRAALEERRIPYLDLTPGLRERAEAREAVYFEVDGHPNEAGNETIARTLFRHLREHGAAYGLAD